MSCGTGKKNAGELVKLARFYVVHGRCCWPVPHAKPLQLSPSMEQLLILSISSAEIGQPLKGMLSFTLNRHRFVFLIIFDRMHYHYQITIKN